MKLIKEENMSKLLSRIHITGEIVTQTGLHIGGSKAALEIGGVDLNVIKTYNGIPYIPGSSFKGKLKRQMIKKHNLNAESHDDIDLIKELFGYPGGFSKKYEKEQPAKKTRLLIPDMYPFLDDKRSKYAGEQFKDFDLELGLTEVKFENTIDRKNGGANPRQLERVPEGVKFAFKLIYEVYNDGKEKAHINAILGAMRMLEDDYLGGQGSRGYGRISFENVSFRRRTMEDYELCKEGTELTEYIF